MRNGLNLGRLSDWLIRLKAALRVDEVGRENGVYKSRFAQSSLTCEAKKKKKKK
jgi:hypothetical protein